MIFAHPLADFLARLPDLSAYQAALEKGGACQLLR